MPTDPLGNALLTIARNAIGRQFGLDTHPVAHFPDLDKPAAATDSSESYAGARRVEVTVKEPAADAPEAGAPAQE